MLLPAAALASTLAGCSTVVEDFRYRPNRIPTSLQTPVKIAILPFKDERTTHQDGSLAWTWLPFVPFSTVYSDRQQPVGERLRNAYYLPDLVGYAIAHDFAESPLSRRLDIDPPLLEDYDIVIHGSILSTERFDRAISYGFGPLSGFLHLFGLPKGERGLRLAVRYLAYDVRGNKVLETTAVRDWSSVHVRNPASFMEGLVATLQEVTAEFDEKLIALIRSERFLPYERVVDDRIRQYHARVDAELPALVAEIERVRDLTSIPDVRYAQEVKEEIKRRAYYLEAYRRLESLFIAGQQEFQCERHKATLSQVAQLRTQRRESGIQLDDDPGTDGVDGSMFGTSDPAAGASRPENVVQMVHALGFESVDPDTIGYLLSHLRGASAVELRQSFLAQYRRKIRSLEQIRAALEQEARDAPMPVVEETFEGVRLYRH
jgi:hypothetical protein